MNIVYTMKGVGEILEVFEDRVKITPKGILGVMSKGFQGTKEIPFTSIVAVQFKKAGAILSGYIQFTIPGENKSGNGIIAATKDGNTFMFAEKKNNELAIEIKEYIDSAIYNLRTPQDTESKVNLDSSTPQETESKINLLDELRELAKLKEQGVLSQEEFQLAKKKLLDETTVG